MLRKIDGFWGTFGWSSFVGSDSKLSGVSVQKTFWPRCQDQKWNFHIFGQESENQKWKFHVFWPRCWGGQKEFGERKEDGTALKMEAEGSEQAVKLEKWKV